MTPPQSRSTTRKEESDLDMDEVDMADEMSSTPSEATFSSFAPETLPSMPSENGGNSFSCKTKGSKIPTINVSNVTNSPHMVFVVGNGKEPLSQTDETFYKTPIMEDEAREAGIETGKGKACKSDRFISEKVEIDCANCEAHRKEIKEKDAKLAKAKEKKRALERKINDGQKKFDDLLEYVKTNNFNFANNTHSEESKQQRIEVLSKKIELLTEQNKEFKCKLIMAGYKLEQKNRAEEEKFRLEKEELVEKMKKEREAHAIEMEQLRAQFGAYEQELFQRTQNEKSVMQERLRSLANHVSELDEQLHASEEREECAAKMNEVLNSTVGSLKEEGGKQDDTLASSARRSRNQRKVMEGLRNRNDELEDENATLQFQLNQVRTQLNEERTESNEVRTELNALRTEFNAVMTQLATQRQRSNNLRINNALLEDLVNRFDTRLDASEGREEENRVLHEELRQMLDNLQFPRRPADHGPNEQVIHDVLLPQHSVFPLSDDQVDITVLHCQIVSEVHIPD